jgi:hypothetical protein
LTLASGNAGKSEGADTINGCIGESDLVDSNVIDIEQEGDTLRNNLFARKQMSELLGIDEAALSRALQKKSILQSIDGGETLFDLAGDSLLEAAKSAGATEEQMAKLVENQDTRTTDDKIEQTLAMMVETGIKAQLVDQAGTVSKTSAELQARAAKVIAPGTGASAGTITEMGKITIAEKGVNQIEKAAENAVTSVTPQDDSSFVKGASMTMAKDLLATPTGYGDRILLAGEDTFALSNDDTVVAGTNLMGGGSSGGSNDKLSAVMMQVGAMIVSAINRKQTDQLFNGGINAPTYG